MRNIIKIVAIFSLITTAAFAGSHTTYNFSAPQRSYQTQPVIEENNAAPNTRTFVRITEVCTSNCVAYDAGLRVGDILYEVNDKPIHSNSDVIDVISNCGGKPIAIEVYRNGSIQEYLMKPQYNSEFDRYMVGADIEEVTIPWPYVYISAINEYGPAAESGLEIGDIIYSVNDVLVTQFSDFQNEVERSGTNPVEVVVYRNMERKTYLIRPKYNSNYGRHIIGITMTVADEYPPQE